MTEKMGLYKCNVCGNIIEVIHPGAGQLVCCSLPMEELKVQTSDDSSQEKHVPVVTIEGSSKTIRVGSIPHPMEKDHYIEWLCLVADNKEYFVKLYPEQEAAARFPYIKGSTLYAYCNKHGLWKTDVE